MSRELETRTGIAALVLALLAPFVAVAEAHAQLGCPVAPSGEVVCPGDGDPKSTPVIIGQENLWFTELRRGGLNYRFDGKLILPFRPLLGLTASAASVPKLQEMQWFFRYTGQTSRNAVFSVEWFAPRDLVDRNLRKTLIPLLEQTEARFNIFYDPALASVWRGHGPAPVDFSRPEIRQMFQDDMVFLRDKYFDHPNYWRIDGKPVLHVWGARELVDNADELFSEARASGVYICGDVFGQTGDEPPLDCRTGFTAATPQIVSRSRNQSVKQVLPDFERYYQSNADDFDLIPAFSFQYDDVKFRTQIGTGGTAIQILAEGRDDLRAWLDLADRYSKPIDGERYIWVGTLNGWAESTTIYPTEKGAKEFWRAGDPPKVEPYHFAALEVIQRHLFPDSPYKGPKIEVQDDGSILLRNCDVLAGFRIKIKHAGKTRTVDISELDGITWLPNLDRVWRPTEPFKKVTIRVKNLDGRRTKKVIR